MKQETKQKLEAIIRYDIEGLPYKFRDLHAMFWSGLPAYKDFTEAEIDELFKDCELEITEQDIEWATFNK
jgi:hypothetical protein